MFYPWNRFHRNAIFELWCITFLTIQYGSRKIGYLPMKHFDQWQADKLNAISLKILINKTGGGGSGWPGRPVATSQTIAAAYAASLYNRIVSGKMTNFLCRQLLSCCQIAISARKKTVWWKEGEGGPRRGKVVSQLSIISLPSKTKVYFNNYSNQQQPFYFLKLSSPT